MNKYNKVDDIPADEIIEMTDTFHRVFNAAGCDPMCHCCEKMIPVGCNFKLSTIFIVPMTWGECAYFQKEVLLGNKEAKFEDYVKFFKLDVREEYKEFDIKSFKEEAERYELKPKEVMLCENCSPEIFMLKELEELEEEIERIEKPRNGGCFRVNGKLVI